MIKNNPLISVIMPTCNRSHMVAKAAQSVLSQTYSNLELIIIDDGSEDDTEAVVKKLNDPRVIYLQHKHNKGGSAARNTGINAAKGELLSFIDDDNLWMKKKLELQLDVFNTSNEDLGIVYVWQEIREYESNELKWTMQPKLKGNLKGEFLLGQGIGGISFLTKRSCIEECGLFDETLKSCQDWDILKRLSDHYTFDYVPKELVVYYTHPNKISTNLKSLISGRTRMVEKYHDEFKTNHNVITTHYKRLGKLHSLNGSWKQSLKWFALAIKVQPLEVLKIIAWLVIDFPKIKYFSSDKDFKKYEIE